MVMRNNRDENTVATDTRSLPFYANRCQLRVDKGDLQLFHLYLLRNFSLDGLVTNKNTDHVPYTTDPELHSSATDERLQSLLNLGPE